MMLADSYRVYYHVIEFHVYFDCNACMFRNVEECAKAEKKTHTGQHIITPYVMWMEILGGCETRIGALWGEGILYLSGTRSSDTSFDDFCKRKLPCLLYRFEA